MRRHVILWGLIPIFNTLYQVFIKLAAHDMGGMDFGVVWFSKAAITPFMWAALISELAAFVIWMKILSDHDLSKAFPLTAISYVMIICVSWFVFHENILPLQLIGSTLILAGVWFIGTAKISEKVSI